VSTDIAPESGVEAYKRASNYLRGDIAQELASDTANVSDGAEQLMKFHGIYAQDNRDVRRERTLAGEALDYIFMIRVVIPGGRISASQWLQLDELADDIADGSLRLTTRQAIQYHGVVKHGLRPLAQRLDEVYLSSFGGCGDVVRNIVTCPTLHLEHGLGELDGIAAELASAFRPATKAHWEIFVNGEKAASREETVEHAFYGDTYLPRKFKIAVSHPHDNCVDVFAQDVGLIPATHPELGAGFNLIVGGGLGRNYAQADTFAHLGLPLTFVTYDEVTPVIAAIIEAYKDLGNRSNRKRARLKYVVADGGLDAFRREVATRYGHELRAALATPDRFDADDHLGWRQLPDGTWQLGLRINAGRVKDVDGGPQLRTALRLLANELAPTFFLTAQQDIVISGLRDTDRRRVDEVLGSHHIRSADELGVVERWALACPALPTCPQALAESERKLPDVVASVEDELGRRRSGRRPLQLRMTGCPNGCARPAVAEVGIVGRTKTSYDLYLGGGVRGDRLATLVQEKVKLEDIGDVLGPIFDRWGDEGLENESFGDFVVRVGIA
jgi:sulfite reductase (ferredoxin)